MKYRIPKSLAFISVALILPPIALTIIFAIIYLLFFRDLFTLVDSNVVHLPQGKALRDLNIHYFRNHSLYRYNSIELVMDENEEMKSFTSNNGIIGEEGVEEVVVITTSPKFGNKVEYDVPCEGICECYVEGDGGENDYRSLGSLVYRHRYTAVVLVTLFGSAISMFYDEFINQCYNAAKKFVAESELTCALNKVICDTSDAIKRKRKEMRGELRTYECDGHCVAGAIKPKSTDCEKKFTGKKILIFSEGEFIGSDIHVSFVKGDSDFLAFVKEVYRVRDLHPYCRSFVQKYGMIGYKIAICKSIKRGLKNIECNELK